MKGAASHTKVSLNYRPLVNRMTLYSNLSTAACVPRPSSIGTRGTGTATKSMDSMSLPMLCQKMYSHAIVDHSTLYFSTSLPTFPSPCRQSQGRTSSKPILVKRPDRKQPRNWDVLDQKENGKHSKTATHYLSPFLSRFLTNLLLGTVRRSVISSQFVSSLRAFDGCNGASLEVQEVISRLG